MRLICMLGSNKKLMPLAEHEFFDWLLELDEFAIGCAEAKFVGDFNCVFAMT